MKTLDTVYFILPFIILGFSLLCVFKLKITPLLLTIDTLQTISLSYFVKIYFPFNIDKFLRILLYYNPTLYFV